MRIINGISYECYERLADGLTSRFANTVLPTEGDLLTVELNDNAIIKCYDDAIVIDIGGNKEFLSFDEFIDIQIK